MKYGYAGQANEKAKVEIADADLKGSGFGRVTDGHNPDGSEPGAKHKYRS
jgi:hypothetical protein